MNIRNLFLLTVVALICACGSSTQLTKTWTDPSLDPKTFKAFNKVLVMTHLKDETSNRIAEDKLVQQFRPGVGVASYSYLQPGDTVESAVNAKLQKDGFDGFLVMRLSGIDKSLDIQSNNYGGYYRRGYYGTTTISEDQTFLVETKIFSFESGKMLWSGTTSTLNPASLEKALDEIIVAIKNQLVKQGFVDPQTNTGGSAK